MAEVILTGCPYDCGGSCPLEAHVEGGRIVRLAPHRGPDSSDNPQLRPCARGLAQLQRVYHPDRLLHPLRRVGKRGEAKFERISWDEALDTVAGEMQRIKSAHGPEAILNLQSSGNLDGLVHRTGMLGNRFFNCFGGQTALRSIISFEGAALASRSTFGLVPPPPGPESLMQSRLVIMWGFNPAVTIFGTNTSWHLAQARERGARFVFVDPRFTESAAALADQWIPIRPGTDTAMLVAMAFVLIQDGLHDQDFLDRYTSGFDRFQDYCLGKEDGVQRSPAWAEPICGVKAEVISGLAREYASTRPADLRGGWAPGRTANGEQFHRSCIALSAMTGNIGIPGGGTGCWVTQDFQRTLGVSHLPPMTNPTGKSIVGWRWPDAVLKGTAGGYPSDIRMIYSIGGDRLNQCADINKGIEALKKVDFVVVQDQFVTPLARYADILLPANTHFEREDIQVPHSRGDYLIYCQKAIESQGESRSDLEILTALAQRLGLSNFNDKTDREWLPELTRNARMDLVTLRTQGICYLDEPAAPQVPLEDFIADPQANPLPTPSGKIEIYSQALAQRRQPDLPPVPQHIQGRGAKTNRNGTRSDFPLLMVTVHSYRSVHSSFRNLPWLEEIETQTVWINPVDARELDIADGQKVRVYNDAGTLVIPARLTERIMPGVVSISQGAWFDMDSGGWDRSGSVNVICPDMISPGEAAVTNAIPVAVSRFEG